MPQISSGIYLAQQDNSQPVDLSPAFLSPNWFVSACTPLQISSEEISDIRRFTFHHISSYFNVLAFVDPSHVTDDLNFFVENYVLVSLLYNCTVKTQTELRYFNKQKISIWWWHCRQQGHLVLGALHSVLWNY